MREHLRSTHRDHLSDLLAPYRITDADRDYLAAEQTALAQIEWPGANRDPELERQARRDEIDALPR